MIGSGGVTRRQRWCAWRGGGGGCMQNVSGTKSSLNADRLAIKEGLKTVKFSGILGDNLCFSGNDAELPGYVIQIKDQKWTLMASHAPDPC